MIYSKAICGRSTIGTQGMKRPPPVNSGDLSKGLYDSCTNPQKDIYVFFENVQIYPEYIIYFRETDPFEES